VNTTNQAGAGRSSYFLLRPSPFSQIEPVAQARGDWQCCQIRAFLSCGLSGLSIAEKCRAGVPSRRGLTELDAIRRRFLRAMALSFSTSSWDQWRRDIFHLLKICSFGKS
jgi:hypothetical protein